MGCVLPQIAPLGIHTRSLGRLWPQKQSLPPPFLQSRERQRTGKERSDSRTRSVRHGKPRRRRAVSGANEDLTGKGNARAASLRRAEKRSESDARNGEAVSDSPLEGAALSVYAKGVGRGCSLYLLCRFPCRKPCKYLVQLFQGEKTQ